MWRLRPSTLEPSTRQWRLLAADRALGYERVVSLWASDATFRSFWAEILREVPFEAYAWECPPITTATATRDFECVFVASPSLAHMRPEPEAFAGYFRRDSAVVTFANLGGDALLVAPCPGPPGSNYSHLGGFVASAPPEQHAALWQAVGEAMQRRLGDRPVWLSTAGLGVGWLHVRLDDRPKYYRHAPYARG